MKDSSQTNPVVLITGALTGIGRASAIAFAKVGARIVVSGRREEEGRSLEAELRKLGAEAEFIRSDVRHEDEVRDLVDRSVERFGRLDAAANVAGTEGTPGPLSEQTPESFHAVFDTNVLGVMLSMKHQVRVMLPNKHGSIVNISSAYGHVGAAYASVYAASKHAVEGLTKSVAHEVSARGLRVNCVAPGPIETGMLKRFTGNDQAKAGLAAELPIKRLGTPEEVANAVVFMSSDKASFITGASLSVDGGRLA
jgi:NAD(P)-dependent dehydrogenase (short-subunit alcohol dehydrogenase family)